jgi:hypothetical protein
MKLSRTLSICSFFLFFVACGNTTKDVTPVPDPTPTPVTDPLVDLYGQYLTACIDLGGGSLNQIYAHIRSSKELDVAILTWDTSGCTGTYTMSDTQGNPVSSPVHDSDFSQADVNHVPDHFFVMKSVQVSDSSVNYSVFHLDGDTLDVLNAYTNPHKEWGDWLATTDVSGFVDDPTHYVATSYSVTHLTRADGLP